MGIILILAVGFYMIAAPLSILPIALLVKIVVSKVKVWFVVISVLEMFTLIATTVSIYLLIDIAEYGGFTGYMWIFIGVVALFWFIIDGSDYHCYPG